MVVQPLIGVLLIENQIPVAETHLSRVFRCEIIGIYTIRKLIAEKGKNPIEKE
jgi:hypothetical protein